jgi:menaquinone-specific isochorismate synthase
MLINGKNYSLDLKKITRGKIDPLSWLHSQPLYPKVFWKEKHEDTIRAAVGSTLLFSEVPSISDPDIRFYGGMRFDSRAKSSVWQSFPSSSFWLPQIELSCFEDRSEIHYYCPDSEEVETRSYNPSKPAILSQTHLPSFPEWEKLVETTLNAIQSNQINKLVLARQTTMSLDAPLSPFTLIEKLLNQNTHSTLFAFQMSPSLCFLGATPEILFKREGSFLTTEAIAGTRRRRPTQEEDTKIEEELLSSEKDRREFEIVKQSLQATLSPLSKSAEWEEKDRVIKTAQLLHLYNRLRIELKTDLSDAELITLLHPTPALGGYPKETALPLLQQLEPFDRGWYGAPIGMVSSQSSAFYAAIRSALIKEREIHLFAGLGLVEGSCPKKEWEELNAKMAWFK